MSDMQDDIHEAIQRLVVDDSGGGLLTSWCICYEAIDGDNGSFGYVNGPTGQFPWRTRGMYHQALAYMDAEVNAAELVGEGPIVEDDE